MGVGDKQLLQIVLIVIDFIRFVKKWFNPRGGLPFFQTVKIFTIYYLLLV